MSGQPPLVLTRRRSVQIMALAAAWAVTAFAPLSLSLPIITGGWRTNKFGMGMAILAAIFLAGAGVFLLHAAKPEWLSLTLDEEGFTLRRGHNRHRREWTDLSGVQLTRRKTGRTSVPSIMVSFQDKTSLYLDDIYTLSPEELVKLMRQHCDRAENPWPSLPPIQEKTAFKSKWKWLLVMPAILCAMGLIAAAKIMWTHR